MGLTGSVLPFVRFAEGQDPVSTQRPGRGCGQSRRAQVQGDVFSDHFREQSARQRADGLGRQGDDAFHRADLPEQALRGGDLFDGFAQDEVHRHGETPDELGDAYQCEHRGVAVLCLEGRQRYEQRRQCWRQERADEQGSGRHAPDEGTGHHGAHYATDAAACGGQAHRHGIHMQHPDHEHVVDREERSGEEVELARGERDGTDDPVPPDETQTTQHLTVAILVALVMRRFILSGRILRRRGHFPFSAFEHVEQHQQRAAHVRHEVEQQGQGSPDRAEQPPADARPDAFADRVGALDQRVGVRQTVLGHERYGIAGAGDVEPQLGEADDQQQRQEQRKREHAGVQDGEQTDRGDGAGQVRHEHGPVRADAVAPTPDMDAQDGGGKGLGRVQHTHLERRGIQRDDRDQRDHHGGRVAPRHRNDLPCQDPRERPRNEHPGKPGARPVPNITESVHNTSDSHHSIIPNAKR